MTQRKRDRVRENIRAYIRGMKASGQSNFTIRVSSDQMHLLFPEYGADTDMGAEYKFDGYRVEVML